MLEPPTRVVEGINSNDSGNILTKSPSGLDFRLQEGIYTCTDCLYVAMPMPHPSELQAGPINPLASDTHMPSKYTSGVRLTHFKWDQSVRSRPPRAKKPKTSLNRNNSSYLSHAKFNERLTKAIKTEQDIDGMWISVGRSFQLINLNDDTKQTAWIRVMFSKAWPLCHAAINYGNGFEVVIGMSSGDLIWLDAVSARYSRINKAGNLTRAAVTCVIWLPGTESQVVAGHADGSVVIYDLDRENGASMQAVSGSDNRLIQIYTSTKPNSSTNPLAAFKVSNLPITDIKVCGDSIAVTSQDGFLRFISLQSLEAECIIPSYYGGIYTIAFSPDGRYFVTAGEDDTLSLHDFVTKNLLAKLVGHAGWVRKVVFDAYTCDTSNDFYRLGSVAEDGQFFIWDLIPGSLPFKQHSHQNQVILPVPPDASIPKIFAQRQLAPKLDRHPAVPLCDLLFTESSIAVVGSDGRVWSWSRPS